MSVNICVTPDGARNTGTRWEVRVVTSPHGGRLLRVDTPVGSHDPTAPAEEALRRLGVLVVAPWRHYEATGAWATEGRLAAFS
jgi:hypothetical protein